MGIKLQPCNQNCSFVLGYHFHNLKFNNLQSEIMDVKQILEGKPWQVLTDLWPCCVQRGQCYVNHSIHALGKPVV